MKYPITFWDGIPKHHLSRERIMEAAEAGFNLIECRYDTETNKQVLQWCEEFGLDVYVGDPRMQMVLDQVPEWEKVLDEIVADYVCFPSAKRFFIKDEPSEALFPTLARIAEYMRKNHPDSDFYINLLPNYGAQGGVCNSDAYLEDYIAQVKPTLLSYDHYCLAKREVSAEELYLNHLREARVSDECRRCDGKVGVIFAEEDCPYYYDNLEQARRHAGDADIPWMIIILVTEHMRYRYLTEAELRWEVFTALSYGASQIGYYHYWTLPLDHPDPWTYHHGIIEADGTRSEKYLMVKQLNREIEAIMHEVGKRAHLAVFHTGEERDRLPEQFTPYGGIDAVDGGRFVVGFYEDGLVLLANKDFHNEAVATIMTTKTLRKFSKARGVWDALPRTADGKYAVRLGAGDGELLRIE